MKIGLRTTDSPSNRGGFTLVELLVAMTIFVILATMSIGAFRTNDAERVSNASSSIRAALEGAKSRALKAQAPRGLRFYQSGGESDLDRRILTSMVYTDGGSFDSFEGYVVDLRELTGDPLLDERYRWAIRMLSAPPTPEELIQLQRLQQLNISGLLKDKARTEILSDKGNWYTSTLPMNGFPATMGFPPVGTPHDPAAGYDADYMWLFLDGTGGYTNNSRLKFRIQLAPAVLPGAEVVQFPQNTCIDLDGSKIPGNWYNTTTQVYEGPNGYFDIIFTPKGTVDRRSVSDANVIFRVASILDLMESDGNNIGRRRPPPDHSVPRVVMNPQRGARLVLLTTQTGFLFNTQLYPSGRMPNEGFNSLDYGFELNNDPVSDVNPFKFAYDGKGAR